MFHSPITTNYFYNTEDKTSCQVSIFEASVLFQRPEDVSKT